MTYQISINDRVLQVEKGLTILQAARQHDIYIPTLCDYAGLPPHGSCRMCVVEIKGRNNTPTACTTPVEDGMVVFTNSPKVQSLRAELLQMLLADHPSSCLFCPEKSHCDECMVTLRKSNLTTGCRSCAKDEQCELQTMVAQMALPQQSFPARYRMLPVKKNDPFFDRDYNLCILCGRCIRTCDELHFNNTLTYTKRGSALVVGTLQNLTHFNAGCSFCGACLEVCPTGSLTEKTRKWDGKANGETVTTCPFCSLGCQIRLQTCKGTVIGSLPDHRQAQNALCVLGRFAITELVNTPARLKVPVRSFEPYALATPWDESLRAIAAQMAVCPPERFGLRISADCCLEDLYIAQKFTRTVMKSDQFQVTGLETYRPVFSTLARWFDLAQPISAIEQADCVLSLGFDGKYTQSVVEVQIHQACQRGAKLISLHPDEHGLGRYANEWLRPRPGEELEQVQAMVDLLRQPTRQDLIHPQDLRISALLRQSKHIVILVGPQFLTHPQNGLLLNAVDELLKLTGARLVILPEQVNLAGAMLVDGLQKRAAQNETLGDMQMIYLIGQALPADLDGDPWIIYQNIVPSNSGRRVNFTLPTTAFSEMDGTLLDATGKPKAIRQAVLPPGDARPGWQILCEIARQMGHAGFDYSSPADILAEIQNLSAGFHLDLSQALNISSDAMNEPGPSQTKVNPPTHMGFPLTDWVEGLRMFYPDEVRAHV